jgi:hypothetical protein
MPKRGGNGSGFRQLSVRLARLSAADRRKESACGGIGEREFNPSVCWDHLRGGARRPVLCMWQWGHGAYRMVTWLFVAVLDDAIELLVPGFGQSLWSR